MGIQLHLTEDVVAFGIGTFLVDPRGRAVGGHDGDLVETAGSGDDVCIGTDHGGGVQALHERALEFIRNEVAALGIHAFLQRVLHLRGHGILVAGHVPECLLIGVRGATGLGVHRLGRRGLLRDGHRHGLGQLVIQRLQTFHPGDLIAEVRDLGFELGVGGVILFGEEAVLVAVGLQKSLGSSQLLGTLVTKFNDSHGRYPP